MYQGSKGHWVSDIGETLITVSWMVSDTFGLTVLGQWVQARTQDRDRVPCSVREQSLNSPVHSGTHYNLAHL